MTTTNYLTEQVSMGDITKDIRGAGTHYLVHGCNAQGVMGSGVAAAIRATYPGAYTDYRAEYERFRARGYEDLPLGRVILHRAVIDGKSLYAPTQGIEDLVIVNAITQRYYGRDSSVRYVDYDAVRNAFHALNKFVEGQHGAGDHSVTVHYPLIGAGLANGDWGVIERIILEEVNFRTRLWVLPST